MFNKAENSLLKRRLYHPYLFESYFQYTYPKVWKELHIIQKFYEKMLDSKDNDEISKSFKGIYKILWDEQYWGVLKALIIGADPEGRAELVKKIISIIYNIVAKFSDNREGEKFARRYAQRVADLFRYAVDQLERLKETQVDNENAYFFMWLVASLLGGTYFDILLKSSGFNIEMMLMSSKKIIHEVKKLTNLHKKEQELLADLLAQHPDLNSMP